MGAFFHIAAFWRQVLIFLSGAATAATDGRTDGCRERNPRDTTAA